MAPTNDQNIVTVGDLEDPKSYQQTVEAKIRRSHASTANSIAILLVLGLIFAFPSYAVIAIYAPAASEKLAAVFEKWLNIISPLIGTAIGAYYGAQVAANASRRNGDSK